MKSHKTTFIALYESESDKLFRYVWIRISNREQVIDTVQESFVKLWDALVKRDKEGIKIENQRAMLFAIARNLIIDWYRKKKPVSLDELMDTEDGIALQFADENSMDIELATEGKMLMSKLRSLSPLYQEVLYLRFVEDFQPKEIAKVLKVSANVISVRIDRGIKELRKLYER